MKTTTDIHDAKMTLAVIAYEHNISYNTINTADELLDWFDVPPDIYLIDSPNKDLAIELVWEINEHRNLHISVREKSVNIIDAMQERNADSNYRYENVVKHMATIQDCINVYKKHEAALKEQFSFYEESF